MDGPARGADQCALLPSAVDRRRARPGAGPARRARGAAGRRQRAAAGDAGGETRAVDGGGAGVRVHRTRGEHALAARGRPGVGGPRSDPGRPRRAGGSPGRRVTAGRTRACAGLGRRSGRALAGPVRRSRREGGPARRAGDRDAVRGCWPTSDSRTARSWSRSALQATIGDVVVGDGTRPPWAESTFDRVLVDAPCTGLGALRRRPESRWRRTRDDLRDLVPLQQALLQQRARLRPARAGWSSTPPARPSSRRRPGWSSRSWRTDPTPGSRTPSRWSRRRPTRSRPTSRALCSCGRTATAPTRCSWRCSGGERGTRRDAP